MNSKLFKLDYIFSNNNFDSIRVRKPILQTTVQSKNRSYTKTERGWGQEPLSGTVFFTLYLH